MGRDGKGSKGKGVERGWQKMGVGKGWKDEIELGDKGQMGQSSSLLILGEAGRVGNGLRKDGTDDYIVCVLRGAILIGRPAR